MKKQSRTVAQRRQSESVAQRHLPLVDILIDTQAELQELVVWNAKRGIYRYGLHRRESLLSCSSSGLGKPTSAPRTVLMPSRSATSREGDHRRISWPLLGNADQAAYGVHAGIEAKSGRRLRPILIDSPGFSEKRRFSPASTTWAWPPSTCSCRS